MVRGKEGQREQVRENPRETALDTAERRPFDTQTRRRQDRGTVTSERIQRRIEGLLDQAEEAADRQDWQTSADRAREAIALDADNADAAALLAAAERMVGAPSDTTASAAASAPSASAPPQPTSFADGRYEVRRFLGEGGKKKVYLAHDARLDRDVAFGLIKTEGLDGAGRERITREAQAMGRLGTHPHIVSVFDFGDEGEHPFIVTELVTGGDIEGMLTKAAEHRLAIDEALRLADEVCQGLAFLHGEGIVHRDLKPGNVMVTADGRAKITDFGLAIDADKSRQTQAGMMVGTPNYMPPEQAVGGKVTPRSDLYSLGAMLYEMVCGQPPFVGDDFVAVVTQHLNRQPVSPTWHRRDCPPALETLILRLLAKDPEKRPASATEVREALQAIGSFLEGGNLAASQSVTKTEPASGADPLYRTVFVGREAELKQLQAAFDAAMSGQGGLVMVVGEPGIGKTALCEQLATYVSIRGGRTLLGHCYEEGSLSLPYLAFVEAMRTYVLARDPDGLKSDLGTGAADVARIVSEVRDRVPVELRDASDPEDDRWRLLQSVTSFLRNAASVQALVIVLEDLHWADRGTLDLLQHVARNLQGARLVIVGTYRDVEVDRSHPLSGAVAELRRSGSFLRVPLRGLTVDEVHRMYETLRGNNVSWAQAEAVHRQTEGNPLFIQEFLRYMVEEGYVVRESGRWVPAAGTVPGTALPEGLRDVIGKRLSRLSEQCNRLLSIAAVIGRDFDLVTLRGVANLSEDDLLTGIEEAVRVGVLEERSVPGALRYRFAHAFFRTALYEEMIAARRLRLHQEVARALEAQYASRREEHAAELADHFGQSTDRADLSKAVEYSELAAKRAMSVFAYAEAENQLQRCLAVQEVLDPDDTARRCDLLLALGDAMLPQEDPGRIAGAVANEAFGLAEAASDSQRAANAALLALESLLRADWRIGLRRDDEAQAWTVRADLHAQPGTAQRVHADIYQGRFTLADQGPAAAHVYYRRAVDGALALGDHGLVFAATGMALMFLNALRDRELLERLAREVRDRPREGVRSNDLGLCLEQIGFVLLRCGDREGAVQVWRESAELAERTRDASLTIRAMVRPATFMFIDGKVEEALALCEAATARALELGIAAPLETSVLLFYLGRETSQVLEALEGLTTRTAQAEKALLLAYLGRHEEAHVIREQFGALGSEADETSTHILTKLLEVAILGADALTVKALSPRLAPLANRLTAQSSHVHLASMARRLGEAAVLLNEPDEARSYYAQALEVCEKVRFRPEIALIRLDLAELLLKHYPEEHDAAIDHLDFAIAELREMKMQPALERALRHRGLLKA